MDLTTGAFNYTAGLIPNAPERLLGSVRAYIDSGTGPVFVDYGDSNGLLGFHSDGTVQWSTDAVTTAPQGDYVHPTLLHFPSSNFHCVVATTWGMRGIHMAAVASSSGTTCGSWPLVGLWAEHALLTSIRRVSAPAVVTPAHLVDTHVLVYVVSTSAGCMVVSASVSTTGLQLTNSSWRLSSSCGPAPVILKGGWGPGQDAVLVSAGNFVHVFSGHMKLHLGPVYTYVLTATGSGEGLGAVGNYITATAKGSVLMLAQTRTGDVHLVAVVHPMLGPAPANVAMPPTMSAWGIVAITVLMTSSFVLVSSAAFASFSPTTAVPIWSGMSFRLASPAEALHRSYTDFVKMLRGHTDTLPGTQRLSRMSTHQANERLGLLSSRKSTSCEEA